MIGEVSQLGSGPWLACFYGPGDDNLAFAEGPTRRGAVATLLGRERARWCDEGKA